MVKRLTAARMLAILNQGENSSLMKLLVMGAGAMGTTVGGFMALAGHDVTLIGRNPHIEALKSKGLLITGIWGEHTTRNFRAFTSTGELDDSRYDMILLAVKSYDTEHAAEQIKPLVDNNTLLCAYQNGLGNAETLAKYFGWERVLGARVIFGARINHPGQVEVTVIAEPTAIGAYHNAISEKVARAIADTMKEAGIPTIYTRQIQTILWSKVAYNCALNPLSALLDAPYGQLAAQDFTRKIMDDVIHELYRVGNAMDIPLKPDAAGAYLEQFYNKLLPPTAAHYASMREDLKKGRRTEIDALNGIIARFGRERGVACPANELLAALIRARESSER